MTTATSALTIKGPVIRECGRHGDYLDDGIAACSDCSDCPKVGILVGRLCQCAATVLNGTERVAWVCDNPTCFGTVVRPGRTAN